MAVMGRSIGKKKLLVGEGLKADYSNQKVHNILCNISMGYVQNVSTKGMKGHRVSSSRVFSAESERPEEIAKINTAINLLLVQLAPGEEIWASSAGIGQGEHRKREVKWSKKTLILGSVNVGPGAKRRGGEEAGRQ